MSNSLSTANKSNVQSTAAQEAREEKDTGIKINTLNKMLQEQEHQ